MPLTIAKNAFQKKRKENYFNLTYKNRFKQHFYEAISICLPDDMCPFVLIFSPMALLFRHMSFGVAQLIHRHELVDLPFKI